MSKNRFRLSKKYLDGFRKSNKISIHETLANAKDELTRMKLQMETLKQLNTDFES
ncbi:MAG: hypothetical protein GY870_15725 [archaeon]|nr:hypothetical protein [archaeon]